jgi:hypothetical protein
VEKDSHNIRSYVSLSPILGFNQTVDYALTVALGESAYVETKVRTHWLATLQFIAEQMTIGMETAQQQTIKDVVESGHFLLSGPISSNYQITSKASTYLTNHSNTDAPTGISTSSMYQHVAIVMLFTRLTKLVPPEYIVDNDMSVSTTKLDCRTSVGTAAHFFINRPIHKNSDMIGLIGNTQSLLAAPVLDQELTPTRLKRYKNRPKRQTKIDFNQECAKTMINAVFAAVTILTKNATDIDSVSDLFFELGKEFGSKYYFHPEAPALLITSLEYVMVAVMSSSILDRPVGRCHSNVTTRVRESWGYFLGFVVSKMTIGLKHRFR